MSSPQVLATPGHSRSDPGPPMSAAEYLERFRSVRATTEALCAPLMIEDYVIQTMADVSPPKWHLAHVTWFFETFVLQPHAAGYQRFHPMYDHLFNSYYETHGQPFPRPSRGLLSRPTVGEVYAYRHHVDAAMAEFLAGSFIAAPEDRQQTIIHRLVLGLHHEQQHQELLLMDIKHILGTNPLLPAYRSDIALPRPGTPPQRAWIGYEGGLLEIGHDPDPAQFAFDNEAPRHQEYLAPYWLECRPVSNGEFMEFIGDGGYQRVELWLAEGWNQICANHWEAPLYWQKSETGWRYQTLAGPRNVDPAAPVCHVSFYEADAYARWAGARLPTEAEWETAAADMPVAGNFLENDCLQPVPLAGTHPAPSQMYGDVWEWTSSAYRPYPGFRALPGSLGEYNGKFMSGQMVLRGGCCATPGSHIRTSYRNFYPPHARWAFSGLRLARED